MKLSRTSLFGAAAALGLLGAGVFFYSRSSSSSSGGKFLASSQGGLDATLPENLKRAVIIALEKEKSAADLQEFSKSMAPEFPIAANALQRKSTGSFAGAMPGQKANYFPPGATIYARTNPADNPIPQLLSPNGALGLTLQTDGNLVLQRVAEHSALWASENLGGPGSKGKMQEDGNFVVQNAQGQAVWSTGTQGHPGAIFMLQDDGNLVMADALGQAIWASNTNGYRDARFDDNKFDPLGTISDVANGFVDVLHVLLPGVDELGDALKKFGSTTFGAFCLQTITLSLGSGLMYVAATNPSPAVKAISSFASLASLSIPGLLKGDSFTKAWLDEGVRRVVLTAKIMSGNVLGKVAEVGQEMAQGVFDKISAEVLKEIGPIMKSLNGFQDNVTGFVQETLKSANIDVNDVVKVDAFLAKEGLTPESIIAKFEKFGTGVREDMAQNAIDAFRKTKSFALPEFNFDGVFIPGRAGKVFDAETGKLVGYSSVPTSPVVNLAAERAREEEARAMATAQAEEQARFKKERDITSAMENFILYLHRPHIPINPTTLQYDLVGAAAFRAAAPAATAAAKPLTLASLQAASKVLSAYKVPGLSPNQIATSLEVKRKILDWTSPSFHDFDPLTPEGRKAYANYMTSPEYVRNVILKAGLTPNADAPVVTPQAQQTYDVLQRIKSNKERAAKISVRDKYVRRYTGAGL